METTLKPRQEITDLRGRLYDMRDDPAAQCVKKLAEMHVQAAVNKLKILGRSNDEMRAAQGEVAAWEDLLTAFEPSRLQTRGTK